ncbi:hypothetical protein ACFPER_13635 [Agromyces aurantiacus]|uniref:Uncharacterized protein n=1 Tax=Agromyces aurantiacus TaxID=165814 RepID=A0ABV9R8K5_9MICO|nr:hypothetical protein [Agromyces aurantiacus]MBM7505266.1 hypothetical protein [Agromyces aurantiacus]
MSVVTAAATRWRDEGDFLRASAVRARAFAADDDGVRADFAASPRAADAVDEAARDAVLRLETGAASTADSAVSAGSTAGGAGFAVDREARAVVARPAGFDSAEACFELVEAGVAFVAAAFDPADVPVARVDAPDFDAAGRPADDDVDARGDRARGARPPDEPAGAGATASPRSADTPVPVPSGVSSSGPDRETEVTPTTYQPPASDAVEPLRTRAVRSRSCYGLSAGSAGDAPLRYPEGRHNGVSRSELADESPTNSP